MTQADNHAAFVSIASQYGWTLWELGRDSTCQVEDRDHLTPIWMKPLSWDHDQMVPVGCLCCTNLDQELVQWHAEEQAVIQDDVDRQMAQPLVFREEEAPLGEPLGSPLEWLPAYRAR